MAYDPNASADQWDPSQSQWRNPPQQVNPASQIPSGGPYNEGRDAGVTWLPGGADAWWRDNKIDPNTGALIGPGGLVPHQYGLQAQALEDQAIWRRQQQLMQQGIGYARGALGLLQSYRPGGGAALESGIYGQLGQMSFQQAQMTQPMDLLSDYRREQDSKARMAANRASERNTAIQIGAIAAGALTGGAGYGAIAAGLGAYLANQNKSSSGYGQGQNAGMGYPQGQQNETPAGIPAAPMGPQAPPSMFGPGLPSTGGSEQGMQSTLGPSSAGQGKAPQAAGPSTLPMQQGGGQQSGQQQQGGGQKHLAQGALGGGGAVGANGDFSPQAYAARAATMLSHPIQQMALARMAANSADSDPVFRNFTAAVDARLAARYGSAA